MCRKGIMEQAAIVVYDAVIVHYQHSDYDSFTPKQNSASYLSSNI